jgi:hypothetical protein
MRWAPGRERRRFQLKRYGQPISEAHLFDIQVTTEEFSFFFQSDQLLLGIFDR